MNTAPRLQLCPEEARLLLAEALQGSQLILSIFVPSLQVHEVSFLRSAPVCTFNSLRKAFRCLCKTLGGQEMGSICCWAPDERCIHPGPEETENLCRCQLLITKARQSLSGDDSRVSRCPGLVSLCPKQPHPHQDPAPDPPHLIERAGPSFIPVSDRYTHASLHMGTISTLWFMHPALHTSNTRVIKF